MSEFVDRDFQLWRYDVSHGRLLLRSARKTATQDNVDIVFSGIEYVRAPRHLRGLSIEAAMPLEAGEARAALGRDVPLENLYVLAAEGRRHLVVAAGVRVMRHAGDIFDDLH